MASIAAIRKSLAEGVADELSKHLTVKNLTPQAFGEKIGLSAEYSVSYIGRVLKGDENLSLAEIACLARAMGKKARIIWWENTAPDAEKEEPHD